MTASNVIDFSRAREAIETGYIRTRQETVRSFHQQAASNLQPDSSVAGVSVEIRPNGAVKIGTVMVEPQQVDAILEGMDRLREVLLNHKAALAI